MERDVRATLHSVSNALRILEAFDDEHPEMGVTELAQRLDLHKSVIFRLVKTLEAHEWVRQEPDRKYRLGLKAFEVGSHCLTRLGLGVRIQPILEELAGRMGETVNLGLIDGRDIMYVNKVTPKKILRLEVQVGVRMPAQCTAMGKVLLTYAPPAELDAFMAGVQSFPAATARSITSPERLREVLREIRARGFSWSDGELFDEICCVAAPVRDASGQVVAALSLAMHRKDVSPEQRPILEQEVTATAELVSRTLGWLPR
jgi:IclR family KDG regulon transcriptional repressor